ncbi:MAG: glycosyltransferase family 117 protein [Rubrobacteraceae bacterium]
MRNRRGHAALVGVVTGLLAFGLYLSTLAPTVLYYELPELRDSSMLQVRAAVLGIADYTGYPTYTLLGKLFTYLPFGDVAYRINLASAVHAALAVGFVYAIGVRLTGRILPSAAGAAAFAVSPLLWSQAVVAEVYALNATFVAAVVFVLLLWRDSRRDRYLLLACFLMGLSLTHHITSGLLLPAAFLFVGLVERRKLVEWGLMAKGAALFLVGLLPYLYIPIRASMDYLPEGFVWGQPLVREYPPDTLYGFYNLVSGGLWKERMWVFGPAELPDRLAMYLERLYGDVGQFHVALVLVGIAGGFYLAYRDRAAAVMFGFLYFGWLFHALEYDIEDIEYYFIPTFLILCVFMSVGFSGVLDAVEWTMRRAPVFAKVGVGTVLGTLFLVSPLTLTDVRQSYAQNDMSEDYHGREIMAAVAEEAKPGATILHHRSPLDYMILVEGRREDLKLVPYLEDPHPYGVGRGALLLDEGPVYILFPGRADTRYYLGVEGGQNLYQRAGYDLVAAEEDVLLYEVVRPEEVEDRERRGVDPGEAVNT